MPIAIGDRVFSQGVGQEGIVVRLYGAGVATVRFPTGERTIGVDSLEVRTTDPFELMASVGLAEDDQEWFDIRLRAARLRAAYGSDDLSGLANSRVVLRPHQVFVAHRVLDKSRPSMIIADEVGLGKTVEAGLILKELRARRSVSRVLIVVPPNLLNQWATELLIKFNEQFEIVDAPLLARMRQLHPGHNPWSRFDRALVSSYLARDPQGRDELVEAGWSLVIIDEAHHCRRKLEGNRPVSTLLYQTAEQLRDGAFGMLLLTATPMQLHPFELFGLVELVEPGLYAGYRDFESDVQRSAPLRTAVNALQAWDEASSDTQGSAQATLRSNGVTGEVATPVARDRAIEQLLERARLTQAIVRNRKRTVGGFTTRRVRRITVQLSQLELDTHARLSTYLASGFASAERHGDRLLGFELVTFQRLLASSSRALASALANRRKRLLGEIAPEEAEDDLPPERERKTSTPVLGTTDEEIAALDSLIQVLLAIDDSKVRALRDLLAAILEKDRSEKVLIFTGYRATQELIRERLSGMSTVLFHGGLSRQEKDLAVARFKGSSQVLISTEAGGEGRNLQFCRTMVNFDLHWNPMRVEQRIGRLDRYGQQRNVHIYNLVADGTIEDRLVSVLERRLDMFQSTVGALELVLGEVENDFNQALIRAHGQAAEAATIFERDLDQRLHDAARVEEQSADFLIELGSFRKTEADQLTADLRESRVTVDLEGLVLAVMGHFPTAGIEHDGNVYTFTVPPALARSLGLALETRYRGTFNAAVAVEDESVDFFAFGHPLVDACIEYATGDVGAGRVAVREVAGLPAGSVALQVNHVLEFTGVRRWARVESMVFDLEGNRLAGLDGALAFARPVDRWVASPSDALEIVRSRAVEELIGVAAREREAIARLNSRRADDERRRADRVFQYNKRRIEDQADTVGQRIQRLLTEGTPEQQRIIPALRGQVDSLGRQLEDLERELDEQFATIDARREVTENLELVSVALLVPAGG